MHTPANLDSVLQSSESTVTNSHPRENPKESVVVVEQTNTLQPLSEKSETARRDESQAIAAPEFPDPDAAAVESLTDLMNLDDDEAAWLLARFEKGRRVRVRIDMTFSEREAVTDDDEENEDEDEEEPEQPEGTWPDSSMTVTLEGPHGDLGSFSIDACIPEDDGDIENPFDADGNLIDDYVNTDEREFPFGFTNAGREDASTSSECSRFYYLNAY
ncbi:hypothetical protein [Cryobacterium sp. Y29]|uniref:hypothetical protein n=1 Tax=Cryobacterium sp. Y29 TaxID=2048285 RepID=UPI0011B0882D|nr:hypothetical protein [Cryobacterium sp. Y29]